MDIWKKIFLMPCMLLAIFFTVSISADQECADAKCKVQNANFIMVESHSESNLQNSAETENRNKNSETAGSKSKIPNPNSEIHNPQSTSASLQSTSQHPQINKTEFIQKTQKLQMPFIANNGQFDETVKFYAKTFAGSVFVTKDGEIVYYLPGGSEELKLKSETFRAKERDKGQDARGMMPDAGSKRQEVGGTVTVVQERGMMGYGPRVTENWIRSKAEILDLFLNSCVEPISQIQNPNSETCCERSRTDRNTKTIALKEEFVGGKINEIKGESQSATKVNYFKGNDPSKWKTDISAYDTVNLGEVYDGIGLSLKAYGNNVEKLFYVKPSVSPETIQVRLNGAKALKIDKEGQLEVRTELGPIKFTRPVAYQEIDGKRVEVPVSYRIQKSETELTNRNPQSEIANSNPKLKIANRKCEYGFKVASYDKSKELIIDPLLASTYLGGNSGDYICSIATDYEGNIFVSGITYSSNFPTTTGVYNSTFDGGYNVFVSKLSGNLEILLASTNLGSTNWLDTGNYIALDSEGNVYVTGSTQFPTKFPITQDVYDTTFNSDRDILGNYYTDVFVSKLSGDLTNLIASTFLGGRNGEYSKAITLDSAGNVYVTGYTYSSNFPVTADALSSRNIHISNDAFISKLSGDLKTLLASTYLEGEGGTGSENPSAIAIDSEGNVYVAGVTSSTDFPVTTGAYDTTYTKSDIYDDDLFISKLSGDLKSLLASTFLGGSSADTVVSMAIDKGGNICVSGYTKSSNFPTTAGAYDTSFGAGYNAIDAFVSKLSGDLKSLLASTFLGGSSPDFAYSIAIDKSGGNIYVTGYTHSPEFPTTLGAYDTSTGWRDAFVSKFNGELTTLLASTFLEGGSDNYKSRHITIDADGYIYVAGYTEGSRFPTTQGAFDVSYNGGGDVIVSKLDSNLSATDTSTPTVVSTNPESNATEIAVDASITATFSEAMNGTTINTSTFTMHDGISNITGTISSSGTTATFIPSSNLVYNTTYTATITTEVKDLAGNAMTSDFSWSFTTGEDPQPVANAGDDQSVDEDELVSLQGSGTAPQGVSLTYQWTQVAGPNVTLSDTNSPTPTFTAPLVNANVTLTFQLVVSYENYASDPDTIDFTIVNVNHTPIAYTGDDQTVDEGTLVTLHGETSYDPDGSEITYQWTQVCGQTVTLSGSNSANPTFTAPSVATATLLEFELVVSDGELSSEPAVAKVTVEHVNHAPLADTTGSTQTVDEETQVTLDGSQSSDPDGDSITYQWTQVSGPTITLSNSNSANPSFTAPHVTETTYLEFELVVNDGQLSSESVSATVTVLDTNQPVDCSSAAPSTATLWPPNHKLVSVSIEGVTDTDNEEVTITITGVTQDEPVDGLGDGDTSPDAVIQGDTVLLRAERSGTGDGRVYEIHFTADDGQGSACDGSANVSVPHDKKKNENAIDSGQNYDSTQQ